MRQETQDPDVYLDRSKDIVFIDYSQVHHYDPGMVLRALKKRHDLGVMEQRVLVRIGPDYLNNVGSLEHPDPELMMDFTKAIAFVMESPLDMMKMREFVRRFQGEMPVEVFNNDITAEAWLQRQ